MAMQWRKDSARSVEGFAQLYKKYFNTLDDEISRVIYFKGTYRISLRQLHCRHRISITLSLK